MIRLCQRCCTRPQLALLPGWNLAALRPVAVARTVRVSCRGPLACQHTYVMFLDIACLMFILLIPSNSCEEIVMHHIEKLTWAQWDEHPLS